MRYPPLPSLRRLKAGARGGCVGGSAAGWVGGWGCKQCCWGIVRYAARSHPNSFRPQRTHTHVHAQGQVFSGATRGPVGRSSDRPSALNHVWPHLGQSLRKYPSLACGLCDPARFPPLQGPEKLTWAGPHVVTDARTLGRPEERAAVQVSTPDNTLL